MNIFKYKGISNKAWNNFIDTGVVSDTVIRIISFRIIEGTKLTEREMAIFCSKTADVNERIRKIKDLKNE